MSSRNTIVTKKSSSPPNLPGGEKGGSMREVMARGEWRKNSARPVAAPKVKNSDKGESPSNPSRKGGRKKKVSSVARKRKKKEGRPRFERSCKTC